MPLRTNGGLFFARGDKDPKTGRNRLLARWVLGEFLRRQHEMFRDPTVGWRKIGEGVNPQLSMEAGSPPCHASLYVPSVRLTLRLMQAMPTEVSLRVDSHSRTSVNWREFRC